MTCGLGASTPRVMGVAQLGLSQKRDHGLRSADQTQVVESHLNRTFDVNAISEDDDFSELCELLELIEENLMKRGSALVHCSQGANRSAMAVCAYLIAKCDISAETAYMYLQRIRPIVEISNPKWGNHVSPQGFLKRRESALQALFEGRHVALPGIVTAAEFMSLVSQNALDQRLDRRARAAVAAAAATQSMATGATAVEEFVPDYNVGRREDA